MKKPVLQVKNLHSLFIIYFSVVIIRFLLAIITSAYPMVNIDEFLYYGMARSIAEGKGLMFRGQPANYSYILYSLVLSPIYLLGIKGQLLYRVLQLWNTLIISLSVFPLYNIANRIIKDKRTAVWAAIISMVLPDFMLGQLMMTENVIIPLFFFLADLILGYLENQKINRIIFIGIIGGLLFSAKPGALILTAVFDLALLVRGIITKNSKTIIHTGISAFLTVCVSALFFGIVRLLGGQPSILSIYQVQVSNTEHLNVFFRFIGIYSLYFILSSGIFCFAVSLGKWKEYDTNQKFLFSIIITALFITVIGVSWSVNRYEYNANTAHMRYIGMYIPLVYFFALKPTEKKTENHQGAKNLISISYLVLIATAAFLAINVYSGVNKKTVFAENMTLASIIKAFRNGISVWIITASVLILIVLFAWILLKKKPIVQKAVTISLLVSMAINNVAAYSLQSEDTKFTSAEQTNKLLQHINGDEEFLHIYTSETISSYYGALDIYNNKGISFVKLNDMFNQLYATHGVYEPFVPKGQRGNTAANPTPDTDTCFMDATVYYMLKLSNNTTHFTENEESLHLVRILDKSKPWLDAIIGGTTNAILKAGETGILLIFDNSYLESPFTLTINIRSDHETTMKIYSQSETKDIQLESGLNEYRIDFKHPMDAYNFIVEDEDIRLYGFDITN